MRSVSLLMELIASISLPPPPQGEMSVKSQQFFPPPCVIRHSRVFTLAGGYGCGFPSGFLHTNNTLGPLELYSPGITFKKVF